MFRFFCVLAAASCLFSSAALAEDYPGSRPISMMMPYAAGGPGDVITRITAAGMSKYLGGTIIVENLAGAGGTIGTAKVASSTPDGHSLLLMHFGHAANMALYAHLPYDPIKDFEPVGVVAESPMAVVARKDFPAKDLRELVDYVKAHKDKITYGYAGVGSASHLCSLLFFDEVGVTVTGIPYKGTGPALTDLMGGQFDFMCDQTLNVGPAMKDGRIKGYAVTTNQRLAAFPNVPTSAEAGMPSFSITVWFGLYAPKGTPQPVIDKLAKALQQALQDQETQKRLAAGGANVVPLDRATPAALRTLLQSEVDRWVPIIKKAGVKVQ